MPKFFCAGSGTSYGIAAAFIFAILLIGLQISAFGSPPFSHKEIFDGYRDHIYINGTQAKGYSDIDILLANYLSDGKYLNASFWLAIPLYNYDKPNSIRSYGMLIDADFNNKSGVQGADYRLRIEWRNQTWERVFEQLQTPIPNITPKFPIPTRILQIDQKYDQVIEQLKYRFVDLDADLHLMGSPERYRVIFYAQDIQSDLWVTDSTDWISIPSPEVELNLVPNPLVIYQGHYNITEIQIKSAPGYEPRIDLQNIKPISGLNSGIVDTSIRVPSHGIASTHLNITAEQNTPENRYTIPIETSVTVLPRSETSSRTEENENNNVQNSPPIFIPANVENQQMSQQAILSIIIKRPPPVPDPLQAAISWFSPIGNLLVTLIAIVSGIAGGIYGIWKYRRREVNKKESAGIHS